MKQSKVVLDGECKVLRWTLPNTFVSECKSIEIYFFVLFLSLKGLHRALVIQIWSSDKWCIWIKFWGDPIQFCFKKLSQKQDRLPNPGRFDPFWFQRTHTIPQHLHKCTQLIQFEQWFNFSLLNSVMSRGLCRLVLACAQFKVAAGTWPPFHSHWHSQRPETAAVEQAQTVSYLTDYV